MSAALAIIAWVWLDNSQSYPSRQELENWTAAPSFFLALWAAMPYMRLMQTVVETPEYLNAAKKAKMTDEERAHAVDFLAERPDAGDVIPGTGGCRKVRIAGKGKGKSGGYRVITFYADKDTPVFLLTVISKGKRADLTQGQRNDLKKGK